MTFQEAIKTDLPLTRKGKTWSYINRDSWSLVGPSIIKPGVFINQEFFLSVIHLTKEDILADDWEVVIYDFESEYK